jgi:spermidine synthase
MMPKVKKTSPLAPATISEADGIRYLHLGTPWVQGAMRLRKPQALALEYIQNMMAWMLMRPAAELTQDHAIHLGLGAAAITKFCHNTLRMRCTAVELNPTVIDACRVWFHLPPNSSQLSVLEMNAADYVQDAHHAQSAQVVCVDLYDHEAASPVLDDATFYQACAQLLSPGGVMSVNLFGRDASFERSAGLIAKAFGTEHVYSLAPTAEGNTVVLALKDAALPTADVLKQRAAEIQSQFKFPAKKWLRGLRSFTAA